MKRNSLLIIIILIGMSFSPVIAQIPAPNSSTENRNTLSVDGFVTTKFASVGSDVEIIAHTRGHISSTQVTADILRYDMDPIDAINGQLPLDGSIVSTVVLQNTGVHEKDTGTMTWRGIYTIPVTSLGGMYGASIKAENSPTMIAVDDSTQITKLLLEKFENHILKPLDTAWDTANPLEEIKSEFDSLETSGTSNGGWTNFVETATKGSGPGGSEQLWNNMIDAGRNNYEMEAGSNFLEALMEFLDSEDVDAGLMMITSLLLYGDEFPLPRVMEDLGEVIDYVQMFDPIENFTRFEGTGDFEAAYNALLGSNEWGDLQVSIDNLANNQLPFQSIQNILHNLALLAVSDHPEAIINALEAWVEPLMDEDVDSMTPIQKLILRMAEMDVEVQDLNGDDIPDDEGEVTWEYELLLDTSEGQAWTAKMEANSPWVNDAFDNFNSLPEDIIGHVFTSLESPVWGELGESVEEYGEWIDESSNDYNSERWYSNGDESSDQTILFGECEYNEETDEEDCSSPEMEKFATSIYDRDVLDLGITMEFEPSDWGQWEQYRDDVPSKFPIAMTNDKTPSEVESTFLERDGDEYRYYGRLTASTIEDAKWSFTQVLSNFDPPCDDCDVQSASIDFQRLTPTMLQSMAWENNDEQFIVSAVGVLVTQDETTNVNEDYNVKATAYSHNGPIENAEVDLAVLRVSPQAAVSVIENLEIQGEITYDTTSSPNIISAYYDADDLLNGDLSVEINPRGHRDGEDVYHYDQLTFQDTFQEEGNGDGEWYVDISSANGDIGIAEVTTTGKTTSGIEFEITEQIPLQGTPDCMYSEGQVAEQGDGSDSIELYLEARAWSTNQYFDTTDFENININWGDGTTDNIDISSQDSNDFWTNINHDYTTGMTDEENINDITIEYKDYNGNYYYHYFTYKNGEGFEKTYYDDESGEDETYYDWEDRSFEWGSYEYCNLRTWDSITPSPLIIDSFITDGPLEVMKEEIMTSDSNGEAVMTVTPTLPGAYVSIAQVKVTRADGEEMIGVGMNLAGVTKGSISIGGDLNQETTFGGIPVYSSERGDLSTGISITPTDIPCEEGHKILAGLVPLDLSEAFPGVSDDAWTGSQDENDDSGGELTTELEFECGETSKNWEVYLEAPLYLLVAVAVDVSGDDEDSECYTVQNGDQFNNDGWFYPDNSNEEYWVENTDWAWEDGTLCPGEQTGTEDLILFPNALHIGIVLNNPDSLKVTGELGPGQVANIALSDEDGPASRILAVATPKEGFDPATIDLSAVTEFLYGEGVREEVGWVANDKAIEEVSINSDAWCEYREDDYDWENDIAYGESNIRMRVYIEENPWSSSAPEAKDAVLKDSNGYLISPVRDWYTEWEGSDEWYANYKIQYSGDYELILDEHVNQMYIEINEDDDWNECMIENSYHDGSSSQVDSADEIFDLIDTLLSKMGSVAWGLGSSADLHLPILSSPMGEYTVLAIAQIGEGDSATIVSAINNEVILAEPNPEPPEIGNVFISFSPADPQIGDTVTINVVNEDNVPVDGLSVTGKKDGAWTIFSMVTNEVGQAEFIAQEGTINILVSGGNYNPAELTIIITDNGITTDNGENLPSEDNPLGSGNNDDSLNETIDDNLDGSNDEEAGTGAGLSSALGEYQNLFLIIIGVLVVIVLVLLSVMKIRGRGDDGDWGDDGAWDDYEEIVNTPMSYNSTPPAVESDYQVSSSNKPPNYIEGHMRDGYEVLEYPSKSGNWWYKDGQTGQWIEWK